MQIVPIGNVLRYAVRKRFTNWLLCAFNRLAILIHVLFDSNKMTASPFQAVRFI